MTNAQDESQALGDLAARQLANATKTNAQLATITPRWLLNLLQWVPVEAGIYRVNRVVNPEQVSVHVAEGEAGLDDDLPQTFVDYETSPREFTLRRSRRSWTSARVCRICTPARTRRWPSSCD